MKEFIYWPEQLHNTAPQLFGLLSSASPFQWVAMQDIAGCVVNGEAVQIRPASANEIKRAQSILAMCEIGAKLGEHIENLFGQHGDEAVAEAKLGMYDAIISLPGNPGQFNDPAVIVDVASREGGTSSPIQQ